MARDKRECGLDRPVTTRGMKVRLAYATCFGLDLDLAHAWGRYVPFSKNKGFSGLLDDCAFIFNPIKVSDCVAQ